MSAAQADVMGKFKNRFIQRQIIFSKTNCGVAQF